MADRRESTGHHRPTHRTIRVPRPRPDLDRDQLASWIPAPRAVPSIERDATG